MRSALEQAQAEVAFTFSAKWRRGISSPRADLSSHAPRITQMHIDVEKIREVIGPGGKMIREICETTGARIDLEDDGTVKSRPSTNGRQTRPLIGSSIAAEPEINTIYSGKVVKVVDFGAFVNFLGNRDGLVHISELARERVGKVTDVVQVGATP